jgi:hypothetical protein
VSACPSRALVTGLKPKTIAQTKRSKGRKTTIEEASEMLGDGRMVFHVHMFIFEPMHVESYRDVKTYLRNFRTGTALQQKTDSVCARPCAHSCVIQHNTQVDFVKQDICREPGLIKGLTHLLNNGAPAARVTAAGYLVFCSLTCKTMCLCP